MIEAFKVGVQKHVAALWLTYVKRGNAMETTFIRKLPGVVKSLEEDEQVCGAVLAAQESQCSVGLDLIGMGAELGPALAGGSCGK
ncbi:MAG: hypothetical protein NZX77_13350 [Polyangiaceae bacterium]|nr:hypothetical protein [Polyangiaceae bacterium]